MLRYYITTALLISLSKYLYLVIPCFGLDFEVAIVWVVTSFKILSLQNVPERIHGPPFAIIWPASGGKPSESRSG